MHPAKKVMCQANVKQTANAEYEQKIWTDRNGLMMPKVKDTMFVRVVIVMETAASDMVRAILSGTDCFIDVRLHAANITNVSSIPIPLIIWLVDWKLKYANFLTNH